MNIEELYQEVILDHSKRPRNFGPLPDATATVKGDNPSCGDEVELAVKFTPQKIEDLKFLGHGCAICMASASIMTVKMRGKPLDEARSTIEAFRHMLTRPEPGDPPAAFGDLLVFGAVRRFPQRVKCATLAWRALEQALSASPARSVSTEESES
ncbi:MAG TPA: SUF system NifU family Fe-S cluster assembly protein [Terrimicrobiaceae bacterium]|nr:SUF system NifU family Fe-S cluster assembly protein [Terrimicrobiaceae bacterium]